MADQGWLFRDGDLILGPVSAQQIIEKLYAGELQPQSEVQALGSGRFLKVGEVPEFKVHVAKAEAKMRIDAQASQHHAEVKQTRNRALVIGAGVLVVLGIIVAVIGNYLAVHGSGGKTAEELAWGDITVDAPTVSKAKRREDDELVDYQGSGKKVPTALAVKQPSTGQPKQPQNTGKPSMGNSDPDGMSLGEVDEAGINSVVAKNKATLIGCIKQVAKPGVYMKIPIEFSIAEAGKVSKVWVDNPDLKDSGLNDCLLKELQKWPFKPGHSGNSVNLSFNVGKKS